MRFARSDFARSDLVLAIWILCAASVGVGGWMIWRVDTHPLSESSNLGFLVFFAVPRVLIAMAAFGLRYRPRTLSLLLTLTALFGICSTFLQFCFMNQTLGLLDARA